MGALTATDRRRVSRDHDSIAYCKGLNEKKVWFYRFCAVKGEGPWEGTYVHTTPDFFATFLLLSMVL
jgi:hypothetical protein